MYLFLPYYIIFAMYMLYFKLFANIKFHYNKYVLFLKLNMSIILYQREEEINEPDFGNFSKKCNEQVLFL